MKNKHLLNSLLLLLALIAGSTSAWATKPWSCEDPETTLDLQTITSSTMGTWNGATSWYLDANYLIVTGYESYKSVSNQTWITQNNVGSSSGSWDASTPFKGSSYYTTASYATLQSGRALVYKVTNLKSLKVYGKNNTTSKYLDIFIYTKSGDEYTQVEEINYTADKDVHIWNNSETLDPSETYFIYLTGTGNSNSQVFEVAYEINAIPHTLSSAVSPSSPDAGGTVTLSSTSLTPCATATATARANVGFKFDSWSITGTGASLSSASTNPTTVTMGSEDAVITANFVTATTYAVNFSVNGVIVQTDNVAEDDEIDFPSSISGVPSGYVLKGWSTETIDGTESSFSSFVTSATATTNITYYAVMAVESEVPASLTKMVTGDTFTSEDKIVVAAIDEEHSLGMYQQTQSSSYVANFTFTEDALDIAANNRKWWNVTPVPASGAWVLGDDVTGHLYSSGSTNLAVSTSVTPFILEDCEDGTFKLSYTNSGTKRYLCCRTDLTSDKKNLFRLSTSDGINKLTLYKYTPSDVIYSNFCTSVPTTTLTLSPACKDGENFYGTYSNTSAFVVPDGLTVSEIGLADQKLDVTAYETGDIVPANTGVMVASTTSGIHTITLAAGGTSVKGSDNLLRATGNGITASAMSAADASCKYYRLTMHGADPENSILGTIGFYWGEEDGAAFDLAANKAYLAVPNAAPAPTRLWFDDEENNATSIEEIKTSEDTLKFIENGQLFIKKDGIIYDVLGRIVK